MSSSIDVLDSSQFITVSLKNRAISLPHIFVMVRKLVVKIGRLKMTCSINLDQMINKLMFEACHSEFPLV